jgi:hypothetical protein
VGVDVGGRKGAAEEVALGFSSGSWLQVDAEQVEGSGRELKQHLECTAWKMNTVKDTTGMLQQTAMQQDGYPTSTWHGTRRARGFPTRAILEGLGHVLEVTVDLLQGDDVDPVHDLAEVPELFLVLGRVGVLHQCNAPAVPRGEAQRGKHEPVAIMSLPRGTRCRFRGGTTSTAIMSMMIAGMMRRYLIRHAAARGKLTGDALTVPMHGEIAGGNCGNRRRASSGNAIKQGAARREGTRIRSMKVRAVKINMCIITTTWLKDIVMRVNPFT